MKIHRRGVIEEYSYRLEEKNNPIAESWDNLIFKNNPPDWSFLVEHNNPGGQVPKYNIIHDSIFLEFHNNNPREMSGPTRGFTF